MDFVLISACVFLCLASLGCFIAAIFLKPTWGFPETRRRKR